MPQKICLNKTLQATKMRATANRPLRCLPPKKQSSTKQQWQKKYTKLLKTKTCLRNFPWAMMAWRLVGRAVSFALGLVPGTQMKMKHKSICNPALQTYMKYYFISSLAHSPACRYPTF